MSLKQRILTISESAERNHFFELRAIAMEVRKMEDRVNQLDEELERTKQDRNAIAKTVREPLLLKLDHANERIKLLEDRIHRAAIAFFEDVPDDSVASGMLAILEEERGRKP